MLTPETPVSLLGYATKRRAVALEHMGIYSVRDLLLTFPRRHEEYLEGARIADAGEGMNVTVTARVVKAGTKRSFKRRLAITEAKLEDASGSIVAVWYNQPYLVRNLAQGKIARFTGKVQKTKLGLRLVNPRMEAAPHAAVGSPGDTHDASAEGADAGGADVVAARAGAGEREGAREGLMPVYPTTQGITQNVMRALMKEALPAAEALEDPLPERIREERGLLSFADAVRAAHVPGDDAAYAAAKKRLAFDEVLRLQLSLGRLRRLREARPAPAVAMDAEYVRSFLESLPYTRTEDQRKAIFAGLQDMATGRQMHRLLDGDVGSGKTLVAATLMAHGAHRGFQSAMMAPTEILAFQHFQGVAKLYAGLPIRIALWTNAYKRVSLHGKEIVCGTKAEAAGLGDEIGNGAVHVVIGTHALVEDAMRFARLALAVVDEQHRFGVRMRSLLCGKSGMPGVEPHLLSMTATPIPRTLAIAQFGDLDLSLLKEKPKGRKEITTELFSKAERGEAYARVRAEIAAGRQAFIVCPLIDPSDVLGAASVTEEFAALKKGELKGVKLGMLHGKMPAAEKERVMADFLARKTMALVSTSVVEVGVDVPNATVMCIEGAERFGLSQLHQFRGRVGRGEHASYCFLLPGTLSPQVLKRLSVLVKHADGFSLAEKDLELRGHGDLLGTAQSGFPVLAWANLADTALLADAKEAAAHILDEDPDLQRHPALLHDMRAAAKEAHLE